MGTGIFGRIMKVVLQKHLWPRFSLILKVQKSLWEKAARENWLYHPWV